LTEYCSLQPRTARGTPQLAGQKNAQRLIDHLEAMMSDKRDDDDVLRVAVTDLINVANLLEMEVSRLTERLDELEHQS
jgi:hypothetical protein